MMASRECLEAQGLALVRGQRLLFEGLAFRLVPGEVLLVTGANGAGKSSLLRLVAGLLQPSAGRLDNPFATALLAGEPALKPDRTVEDEIGFWAGLDGAPPLRVAACVEAMAVSALLPFRFGHLSSGQRQRVAMVRTMASGARLWLLDEPTTALDAEAQARLYDAIAAHRSDGGMVIAATHQPLMLDGAQMLRL